MAENTILSVNDINVYYGQIHAVKGISFEVQEGEIVSLVGANGAGKTTTLGTVSGLLRSKTGSIEFAGESIFSTPAHKIVEKGLAHVPEGRRIFQQLTVEENLDMGAFVRKANEIEDAKAYVFEQFPRLKERRRQQKREARLQINGKHPGREIQHQYGQYVADCVQSPCLLCGGNGRHVKTREQIVARGFFVW